MLDTLLEIGKTLRKSEAGKVRYHRYFRPAPLSDEKKKIKVVHWSVPVDETFKIKFDQKNLVIDQNLIRNKLFYLAFKTSETGNESRYLFGDIEYGTDKDGKEIGFYKIGNPEKAGLYGKPSFNRAEKEAQIFVNTVVEKFRVSFNEHQNEIEDFLREHGQNQFVYLHFDFGGKSWYEFEDELRMINDALLGYFIEKQNDVFVLRNFIYKTLIKSVSSSPDFSEKNTFKTRAFKDSEEVLDLIYSLDYSKKALISERDIKIIILPRGKKLDAQNIIDFFEQNSRSDLTVAANQEVETEKDEFDEGDSIFSPVVKEIAKNITQFDFIFSKRGEKGKDDDLLEISGIEQSFLDHLNKKIKEIKNSELLHERRKLYPTKNKQFWGYDIRRSFLNILGSPSTRKQNPRSIFVSSPKAKYQGHLFKVLPQIYTGSYYRDDVLLPAFVEMVEFGIRHPELDETPEFNLLKYDYYFLVLIRNKNGGEIMEEMKTSDSYKAGLLLGKMAQPLRKEINSFEKNYVGLLSRRIADINGLINLGNFINQKLMFHAPNRFDLRSKNEEFSQIVKELNEKTYRKNYCVFGFFESYFSFSKKQSENDNGIENQTETTEEENQ